MFLVAFLIYYAIPFMGPLSYLLSLKNLRNSSVFRRLLIGYIGLTGVYNYQSIFTYNAGASGTLYIVNNILSVLYGALAVFRVIAITGDNFKYQKDVSKKLIIISLLPLLFPVASFFYPILLEIFKGGISIEFKVF